jgi:hypothetical protein
MQLTPEQEKRMKSLKREDQTPQEVFEQIFNLGLYALEYRREKNPKRLERQKEERQLLKSIKERASRDPELAVKLGLGTRPEL